MVGSHFEALVEDERVDASRLPILSCPFINQSAMLEQQEVAGKEELLRLLRAAKCDIQHIGPLLELLRPRLFAIALRFVKDRDMADDVLQDVALGLIRGGLHCFDEARLLDAGPLPYLSSITRRKAIDAFRNRHFGSAKGPYLHMLDDPDRMPESGPRVGDESTYPQSSTVRLNKCLERLSPSLREAISAWTQMKDIRGKVLADELGISHGAFRGRLKRALEQLKVCLDGDVGEVNVTAN